MTDRETLEMRANALVPRKIGVTETFMVGDREFTVKRVNHNTWHLRNVENTLRSRFGSFPEILADVENVLATGNLPPPAGPRW